MIWSKRDTLRWLRKKNEEQPPEWPWWVHLIYWGLILAFCGRVAWVIWEL